MAQALAERMGDPGGVGGPGLDALGGGSGAGILGGDGPGGGTLPAGMPTARAGSSGGSGKGRPGSKKKKGGRVTPKADGGRRGR